MSSIEAVDWKYMLHSELYTHVLHPEELIELCEKYGPTNFYRAKLTVGRQYYHALQHMLFEKKDRRGEVVFIVRNRQNRLLLHTKPFYPPETFRLPTGGIRRNESVLEALYRELAEETSFSPIFFHFQSLVLYTIVYGRRRLGMCSYLFEIETEGERPISRDSAENISGFEWLPSVHLPAVIEHLEGFTEERWRNWGEYRAVAHRIVAGITSPHRKQSASAVRLKNDLK